MAIVSGASVLRPASVQSKRHPPQSHERVHEDESRNQQQRRQRGIQGEDAARIAEPLPDAPPVGRHADGEREDPAAEQHAHGRGPSRGECGPQDGRHDHDGAGQERELPHDRLYRSASTDRCARNSPRAIHEAK